MVYKGGKNRKETDKLFPINSFAKEKTRKKDHSCFRS